MTSSARKILDEALALPESERRLLAEALLESTESQSAHEIDPAWRDEIMRRIERVQCGEAVPEPWSEVRRKIDTSLGR